ncbi:MAG: hypothetical protein RLZZ597_3589, partial [Cyanobacteriota bacterium]
MTVTSTVTSTAPLLLLDGRFVSAEIVAVAMAKRPPDLPPHRCVVLGSEDFSFRECTLRG